MKDGEGSVPLETPVTDSLKSLDLSPVPRESDPIPELTKAERAKALLEEMMEDIANISELIKFVCEENAIKVPIQVVESKL
ncbi:hypothetical protein AVEN_193589-1 [Araneus ventricosus]|uniref:Uncharacterized protein n=1 Tax=Araneus ventricosus TaxID=182803 RepID=A0A4Y2JBE1_ARAVE|nr:hypothetical protein AVEN_193589-1 [Araneus ventricosus]